MIKTHPHRPYFQLSNACLSLSLDRATLDTLKIRDGASYTLSDQIVKGRDVCHPTKDGPMLWTIIMISKDMVHQIIVSDLKCRQLVVSGNNFEYLGINGVLGQYSIHII